MSKLIINYSLSPGSVTTLEIPYSLDINGVATFTATIEALQDIVSVATDLGMDIRIEQ